MESTTADATGVGGILLVDKPAGMTSHDVVAVVRRAVRTRRAGHAGTLDPFATGLMVVLISNGTRLIPYLEGEPKIYDATIRFGAETDTDDSTGAVVREAAAPSDAAIAAAIPSLTGELDQLPPAYSAKQVGGQRAYDAARKGKPLDLEPARVTVHEWNVGAREGNDLPVRITCGGGTYIRALARDLGRLTNSAAHLAALRRVASGPFSLDDATSLEQIDAGAFAPRSLLDAIPSMPRQTLDDADLARVSHGNAVASRIDGGRVALLDGDGRLVAVAIREKDLLLPKLVLKNE
jgi:tRNA pseudouridine55 synthase